MNKVIGVLSLIGTVISVATFVFDLRGRPVSQLGPRARFAIAVVLALVAIWSWRIAPADPNAVAAAPARPQEALTETVATTAAAPQIVVAQPAAALTAPPAFVRESAVAREKPKAAPRSMIRLDGVEDDELTMLLRNALGGRAFSGSLERTCTKDDALAGLITCELTLRVRIADDAAFSADSRGGGFTERAAEKQARERLTPMIEEKIRAWRSNA